jgi:hypothetical protein
MSGVPFTVMQCNGGPYDDQSFMSGFYIGTLNFALSSEADLLPNSFVMPLYSNLVKQADLIAMQHGWLAEEIDRQEEWSFVRFRKSADLMLDE